jgi:hypothetical protein
MLLMVPPADERQRRMFYGVFGMLMLVLVLMFLSQGRRAGRSHPEDLDLSFKYDEKEKTLTLHLFKSPIEEGEEAVDASNNKKPFAPRRRGDVEWDEAESSSSGSAEPSVANKSGSGRRRRDSLNGLFKRLKSHV